MGWAETDDSLDLEAGFAAGGEACKTADFAASP